MRITIEEYISRRKKEDCLNEFNLNSRVDNMRICVNYIFEYFNNYLDTSDAEEITALQQEKIDKFSNQLFEYELNVKQWLVNIYAEYGKHIHRNIGNLLKGNPYFLLFNSEDEFRSISYDCYSKLIKKFPFLKDQTEMLFLFIKDYHRVQNQRRIGVFPFISDEINVWIEETKRRYQINVLVFSWDWVDFFYDNENIWPASHRRKSEVSWRKYEYEVRQKTNLFNLDSLYRNMPKKPYTKGRKQEFEIIMLYYWLHEMIGDESGYWQEYLEKTLASLK